MADFKHLCFKSFFYLSYTSYWCRMDGSAQNCLPQAGEAGVGIVVMAWQLLDLLLIVSLLAVAPHLPSYLLRLFKLVSSALWHMPMPRPHPRLRQHCKLNIIMFNKIANVVILLCYQPHCLHLHCSKEQSNAQTLGLPKRRAA
jgi:hypothetical protein